MRRFAAISRSKPPYLSRGRKTERSFGRIRAALTGVPSS
jgi:hypothetical protein